MNRETYSKWYYAVAGFGVGIFVIGLVALALIATTDNTVEVPVEVETIVCPPAVDAAVRMRLFYGEGTPPPEIGPLDLEFAEACGFEGYGEPESILPPEAGA